MNSYTRSNVQVFSPFRTRVCKSLDNSTVHHNIYISPVVRGSELRRRVSLLSYKASIGAARRTGGPAVDVYRNLGDQVALGVPTATPRRVGRSLARDCPEARVLAILICNSHRSPTRLRCGGGLVSYCNCHRRSCGVGDPGSGPTESPAYTRIPVRSLRVRQVIPCPITPPMTNILVEYNGKKGSPTARFLFPPACNRPGVDSWWL